MDVSLIPTLLALAWLLPLASFVAIVLVGKHMGQAGKSAGYLATLAICFSFVASASALALWCGEYGIFVEHGANVHEAHEHVAKTSISGEWYSLGEFGRLRITIGYYVDSLTVIMFTMVTLIASCIHFYAQGYMSDELEEFTDPEVVLKNGENLKRPGRYHRFFQYLSLFCFSMLGIVIAGNMAMTFAFWELVGVCSYFLIGFYIERKSASTAANKAFIVNRVGDFGMLIGLMALWASLGTFNFGDTDLNNNGHIETSERGIFSQVRTPENHHHLETPAGMIAAGEAMVDEDSEATAEEKEEQAETYGYWLLIVAGIGIFCGCVGKSAQFPLHTWLPDAMEGPTPVSALVHSATMVAAGVYLAARFYPVFAPEVLMVIAIIGCITLFMAATIAITATDIKRVLAYSTVSQLGYMMFAIGVGGWVAGVLHLITHAFFKSLLFMCSGSVIHAVHTNEMTEMGGLRKKMPWTAGTMLIGCLAIIGAGVPFLIGFSGYYSKDAILAQALSFQGQSGQNPLLGAMFYVAAAGAAMTAFYMFRLWYMTFAGEPRNQHRYDHAHESPKVMYFPLVVLAFFAAVVVWPSAEHSPLVNLIEQAVPDGTQSGGEGVLANVTIPAEHDSHADAIHIPTTMFAFSTALVGFLLATMFYGLRKVNPGEVQEQFSRTHNFLLNKWWFDELYDLLFVRPAHAIAKATAWFDKNVLDWLVNGSAKVVCWISRIDDIIDRFGIDWLVNAIGRWTYNIGTALRAVQTGRLRQYAMFIAVGTVTLFVLISFWNNLVAG